MFIILDENHIDPLQDPVQKALEAFVEAARQSDKPYTLDTLTEMVRGELLQEAGGVFSWLKRWISGTDTNLLDEIDDAIDNANRIVTDNNVSRWFTTAGLSMLISIIPLVKMIARLSNADQRKAFRESLHKLRSEVVALKLKD